jgi:hypothetical protein
MISRYDRGVLLKEFLPSVVMAVLSLLFILYGIVPGIKYIQEMFTTIRTVNTENTALKKKINVLVQFDPDTLSQYMTTLLSAVPADKAIASILTTIETVAIKNNVSVLDLTVVNPGSISTDAASMKVSNPKLGSNTIQITTSVDGSSDAVQAFITEIRKVRRLMRIATLTQTFTVSTASPSAKTNLMVEAFYAPLPQTLGSVETEVKPFSANEEQLISTIGNYPMEYEIFSSTGQIESGNKIDPFSF